MAGGFQELPLGKAGLGREESAIVPGFTRGPDGFTNAAVRARSPRFGPVPVAPHRLPRARPQGQAGLLGAAEEPSAEEARSP